MVKKMLRGRVILILVLLYFSLYITVIKPPQRMKTLSAINEEIKSLESEAAGIKVDLNSGKKMLTAESNRLKKRFTAIGKRVSFLRMCARYLETQPSTEFLQKEENRLKTRLELIDGEFKKKFGSVFYKVSKEDKKEFYKAWDTTTIKSHLKNIQFLIN